jgi:hypothetical protein
MTDLRQLTIISGGQTGADRAALDFAIERDIPHGGWCPRGRLAEDGPIPPQYALQETPSRKYSERTEWNVRDSDATVAFTIAPHLSGGTALAIQCAKRLAKPMLHLSRDALTSPSGAEAANEAASQLLQFIEEHQVRRLNVAGPRASQEPQIADFVQQTLHKALPS